MSEAELEEEELIVMMLYWMHGGAAALAAGGGRGQASNVSDSDDAASTVYGSVDSIPTSPRQNPAEERKLGVVSGFIHRIWSGEV
jgi:hypothetical protein